MKAPKIYAEWIPILELLKHKERDEEILLWMKEGSLDFQTGVTERFMKRMIDAVNYRMNLATDKFQRDSKNSSGREGGLISAILSLRKEFAFLYQIFAIPVIPESLKKQYQDLIRCEANKVQKSLEESAKKDRSGKLSKIIRDHKINLLGDKNDE